MAELTRRKTLALIGGGTLLAAGGVAADLVTPPTQALKPWAQAGRYADPRMRALSWAILAPNPHNRQPWLVDLREADRVTLYVDTDRLLPHTDPFSRQIVIGLGCFLETLQIAAAADGWRTELDVFPRGADDAALDRRPVAVITFEEGGKGDADFAMIPHRRTQKEPYDLTREVPVAELAGVVGAARHGSRADGTVAAAELPALRRLSEEALRIELETPRTYRESVDLFRIGRKEVNANPDGIDFSGPMFQALARLGLFSREVALEGDSMAFQAGYDAVMENARTAMGYVWLCTQGNGRVDQIAAGRDWMRVHLAATRAGVALQPLSQALQEYPEMAGLYGAAHERLAKPGETVQMWARLGYSPKVPQSPRWPLEAKIMHG